MNVIEIKKRNPPPEAQAICCGECGNVLLIQYELDGYILCPLCGTYTTVSETF